jgi:hypothetical protein
LRVLSKGGMMGRQVGGRRCVDEGCVHRERYPEHKHYDYNPYRYHVRINRMMDRHPEDSLQEYVIHELPWGMQN